MLHRFPKVCSTCGASVLHKKHLVAQTVSKLKQVVSRNPSSESLLPYLFLIERDCPPGGSGFISLAGKLSSLLFIMNPLPMDKLSAIFLLSSDTGFTHKKSCFSQWIAWINSLLEKGMYRNPSNLLLCCRRWARARKPRQVFCLPNLSYRAFCFPPSRTAPFLNLQRSLREKKYFPARPSCMGRVRGLQQLLGVWVPLADVCYSSHFINVGNKTPDYSWPKRPLFDWQPVCVSYDITHCITPEKKKKIMNKINKVLKTCQVH